ncbi:glycosyl transferase [Alphaproteobacteria bacterium]|nr:glycosyl transferase [Alphaproteobacteria bacterium]
MLKIILCAFNEAQNLEKLLVDLNYQLHILQRDFEIIFCLDGTTDNSAEIIKDFSSNNKITILPVENIGGLGNAYKKIFLYLIKNSQDDDLIISLDADNTHNPEQIQDLIDHFEKNSLDLLIASRFYEKSIISSFPIHRRFISKTTSIILQLLFRAKNINNNNILDYTSGFRLYKTKILKNIYNIYQEKFICEPEFTYTCELLIKIAKFNYRIDEIPILYDYNKKLGKSKLKVIRNLYRLILMIFNLKFTKFNFL